jgi:hypothetical protein
MRELEVKPSVRSLRDQNGLRGKPQREADMTAGPRGMSFTSVERFSRSLSWNVRLRSARAVEPVLRALCPWHGRSSHENQQRRDETLLRIRDVPPPCCVRLSS